MKSHSVNNIIPTIPSQIGRLSFDLKKSLWLWITATLGLTIGLQALSLFNCVLTIVITWLTLCLGHSIGLHRGLIHETYKSKKYVQNILTTLFIFSGLGGPISWAVLHAQRDFWQNQKQCPAYFKYNHSIAIDFIWNLHFSFQPADKRYLDKINANIFNDRYLLFLEKYWLVMNLIFALVIFLSFGYQALAVAFFLRVSVGILAHWFIGYYSHKWGPCEFEIAEASVSGTNNWLLGVVSFGEGFHNNHHAFPKSAKMGLHPGQWDLGWYLIKYLKRLNLIYDVKTHTTENNTKDTK